MMLLSLCEYNPPGNAALGVCVCVCVTVWKWPAELNLTRPDMHFESNPLVNLFESTVYLYYE